MLALGNCAAAGGDAAPLTATERERVLAHGPWPPASTRDPSNRVSGDAAAIVLGRLLFFDAPLSRNGYVACATCHQPDRAFTDGRARAQALAPVDRNTQPLFNLRLMRWFGWGGASDSLWMASLRSLLDAREMAATPAQVVARLARNEDLACRYRQVFGRAPDHADDTLLVNLSKALAAFQETLGTARTPFDAYRDALAHNDAAAQARYPAAAQRGLKTFFGRGNCAACHSGPSFSNGEFHDIGSPFFVAPGVVDPGRHAGIRALRDSPFNLLGVFNDDPRLSTATGTRHVTLEHRHWGEWRVPSLRNVALTAPYMHNGSLATLRDVVLHYVRLDPSRLHADGERLLRRLDLTDAEIDDLVAFLESLTELPGPPHAQLLQSAPACRESALRPKG